ncbi:hypothetical protein L2E82_50026 [Cichorium intybus]|nr:hypothetical protein L2E82_50026 [Cichorium intybus]
MTVLSEIGDKTFFAAAISTNSISYLWFWILAMRHLRRHVLAGCLTALIVITILSAAVGMAAPNLISRTLSKHVTTILIDDAKDYDDEDEDEEESEPELSEARRLYIGNLLYAITSSELSQIFGEGGDVVYVEIVYDRVTDRSRGFAFIHCWICFLSKHPAYATT